MKPINISLINSTNVNVRISPAQERQTDSNYDPSCFGFNWTAVSFDGINLIL